MRPPVLFYLLLASVSVSMSVAADELPVTVQRDGKQVVFRTGDREIARYQAEPGDLPRPDIAESYRRGGYLHPLRTPAGHIVTDDYPENHIHHHGIWMPWTKTTFDGRHPDFWNMGQSTGRVEFEAVDLLEVTGAIARLRVRHRFVDLTTQPPVTALNETWDLAVSAFGGDHPRHVIDLTSTQRCATDKPLGLPAYHYGGFGFRGLPTWNGADNCHFLTSEGITDRLKGNESRGKWCWVGGAVPGGSAGVTLLGHPSNFRFPQPLRLHPKEPFLCFAPQQLGDMAINPGQDYVSRYRIVITDGQVTASLAESWWQAWADAK
jgi:hypothetical protein